MSDYDYGNARLRVMKSRLLSRHELEMLADSGSLQGLIAALTKTVYQKSVEAALTRASGMQCIDEALRRDLVLMVGRTRDFYKDDAGEMISLVLRTYDIHNLKAILRGLSKNVPAGEILAVLLPIGELNVGMMNQLARLNNPREAMDLLASMNLPFARPLLKARAEIPGMEIFEMELALDRWYYEEANRVLKEKAVREGSLSYALALEADLVNVSTALRFAQFPQERDRLRERLGSDELERLFVGQGRIPFALLADACRRDTVAAALETLSGTFLQPALHAGLEAYARSNRLSDIERRLRHYRLAWMAGIITKDPLGIGVFLGFTALKVGEIGNIRWIAQGINLGLKVEAIRAELETVP